MKLGIESIAKIKPTMMFKSIQINSFAVRSKIIMSDSEVKENKEAPPTVRSNVPSSVPSSKPTMMFKTNIELQEEAGLEKKLSIERERQRVANAGRYCFIVSDGDLDGVND